MDTGTASYVRKLKDRAKKRVDIVTPAALTPLLRMNAGDGADTHQIGELSPIIAGREAGYVLND